MIICGIDPGTRVSGYAIIEIKSVNNLQVLEFGNWTLTTAKQNLDLGYRLETLHQKSSVLFQKWNPRFIGLEKAVSFKNIDSAHKLSEARAIIRLSAFESLEGAERRILELSPTRIKKYASGFGSAKKTELSHYLKMRFPHLPQEQESGKKLSSDAYDALAIAWTVFVLKGRGPLSQKSRSI